MSDESGVKSFLPSKKCPVCERLFSWKKKWANCWHRVAYCSSRCKEDAHSDGSSPERPKTDEKLA